MKTRLWYFLIALGVVISCTKEPSEIGLELQPQEDLLNVYFSDTTTIIAYTIKEDSLRSDEPGIAFLGDLNDPVFGKTSAAFYAQTFLTIPEFDFGDSPVLDSVVLTLAYTGDYYGDTNTQFTAKVHELLEDIYYDSSYFSNQSKQVSASPIGQLTFIPRPNDSIVIDSVEYAPQIRIPLSAETGMKFINASEEDLKDNTAFVKFFKGIYVNVDPVNTTGGLIHFSLTNANSRILVYFHQDTSSTQQIFRLVMPESGARYNYYNHHGFEGSSPEFYNQVINGDTATGQEKLYLQGLAGTKVRIKFPYIKDWYNNQEIAVNLAELVISDSDTASAFDSQKRLSLVGVRDGGATYMVVRDQLDGTDYFGGFEDDGDYRFRVTRYIQGLLQENIEDEGLALIGYLPVQDPSRMVINGTSPASPIQAGKRLKLKLTYTKLP